MPLTASGGLSLPLENLRTLLSNCTTFQTWTGTATPAAAAARIYLWGYDGTPTYPTAIVFWGDANSYDSEAIASGGPNQFGVRADCDLIFLANIDTTYTTYASSFEQCMMAFCNDVGGIIDSMKDLAGSGAYLNIESIRKIAGPSRSDKSDTQNLIEIVFRCTWAGI